MEEDSSGAQILSNSNRLKRYKRLIFVLGTLITVLGTLTLTLMLYTRDRGTIASGVVIEIPLGNLSISDARLKLEQKKNEILNKSVHFTSEGKTYSIKMEELGLTYSYDAALHEAYLIGRQGNNFKKAFSRLKASWGVNIRPVYQWDDRLIQEALNKDLSALNIPVNNARYIIKPDNTMEIVPEKSGRQVDISSLIKSLKELNPNQAESTPIPIPIKEVPPAITKAELETLKMTGLRSSYTTHFNPNQIGRTQNIRLAAKTIDGTVLKPMQEFSFNQTVGPRTAEAGYQMAIIIEGNQFVPGLGGGICQVSSTLYNAVRLAALRVSERSRHSLAVTYVPPDQDATVAYPDLDFKFINDSGSDLLIRSIVHKDTLTFELYGKK